VVEVEIWNKAAATTTAIAVRKSGFGNKKRRSQSLL
jgi:hypothetical protein